jgi:hypothetical protein
MPTGPSIANCSTGGLARRRLPSLRWPPSLARSPRQHPAAVHQSDGARAHRWVERVETFRNFVIPFSKIACVQAPAAGMLIAHSANTARMPKPDCGVGFRVPLFGILLARVRQLSVRQSGKQAKYRRVIGDPFIAYGHIVCHVDTVACASTSRLSTIVWNLCCGPDSSQTNVPQGVWRHHSRATALQAWPCTYTATRPTAVHLHWVVPKTML